MYSSRKTATDKPVAPVVDITPTAYQALMGICVKLSQGKIGTDGDDQQYGFEQNAN
jgi:hypothetical protein